MLVRGGQSAFVNEFLTGKKRDLGWSLKKYPGKDKRGSV